ncbi:MAG: peptidylprolyl isomerase [Elusimicrobiota bacterium]|jgi:parvulin-like peptidyl-prolyl isomerase|nr:peptidylprolyl isomerase [Elusimicrobiota bacterium]
MKKTLFVLTVALVVSFSACAKKDPIVARVGKAKITQSNIESRLMNTAYQEYVDTPSGKKQFIDLIVRETIMIEAAKKSGINKEKSYKEAVDDFKQQQARQFEEYKDNLLVELYFRTIQNEITISDADIQAYYNVHKEDFDAPIAYTVRHIFTADRETAEKAYNEIQKNVPFEKVVSEYSQDAASVQNGGLIGPFKKGEVVPEFENVALALKQGEVSNIVETSYGYYIIYKVSQRYLPAMSFNDAVPEIRRILEREKFDRWFEAKKQELKVKVDYDVPI